MVHELHTMGYQRLRICPSMSASGLAWRCAITPVSNVLRRHGAWIADWDHLSAHYSSSMEARYFGWNDGEGKGPKALARMFRERFPEIAAEGYGADWEYAGWYSWMLSLTEPDSFPYAYADWDTPSDVMQTTGGGAVPLPPSGEAESRDE